VPAPPQAVYGGAVGTLALAALTTGFGVLTASGARRRGLLAALLLPAGLPALLAGVQLASANVPVLPWAVLVTLYAAVVVVAAWAVFPALLEE
jgi:heme exporter protein B